MITLVPPIAANKAKLAGEFWHSDWERSTPTLEVVMLYRRETRALFEADNNEPVCRSDDAKRPAVGMPLWEMEEVDLGKQGKVAVPSFPVMCQNCPFAEWALDGTPPACGNSYLLLVDRGNGDLAQLRVKGTSIGPYRRFISKKPQNRPMYHFRTTITSEDCAKGTRRWFEMRFKAEPLEEEEARRYDLLLRSQARFEVEHEQPEPEEISAFMAEVLAHMEANEVKPSQVAKFMKADFSEANVIKAIKDSGQDDPEAFIVAVRAATERLPFE
jgi:hypothetical protein